jgi:orotate phosphoribosyltransferase
MTHQELAAKIYNISYLRGEFILRSGQNATEYFDKYRFEAKPELLKEIARQIAPLVPKEIQVLAGLEMGGIPIATAISLELGLPICFVRKEAKSYGTMKLAEGAEIKGKKVCIIEDVITTGGQVIESTHELRKAGAEVSHVLCVIDREQGGDKKLLAHDLKMLSLFNMSELKSFAK